MPLCTCVHVCMRAGMRVHACTGVGEWVCGCVDWRLLNVTIFAETDCPARKESDCSPPLCNWTGMTCTSLITTGTPQLVCTRRQTDLTLQDETRPNYFTTSAFFGLGHKYAWVRGFVRAYTAGSPDAFRPESGRSAHTETTIDEPYVDGLSITHGTGQPSRVCPHSVHICRRMPWNMSIHMSGMPRKHITTYAAGLSYGHRGYSFYINGTVR